MVRKGELPAPRLRGSPARLSGRLRLEELPPLAAVADLPELRVEPGWVTARSEAVAGEAEVTDLKLGLPRTTPPGSYRASVPIGERTYEMLVDVEPVVRLRLSPTALTLRGAPGTTARGTLTVLNLGNVAAEIPPDLGLGLFDVAGVDRAIGIALRAELDEGQRRVDLLFEEFARQHAGLARIRLTGAKEVPPGDSVELEAELELPEGVRPGRTYYGMVRLHEVRYRVRVVGAEPAEEPTPEKPRSRGPRRKERIG